MCSSKEERTNFHVSCHSVADMARVDQESGQLDLFDMDTYGEMSKSDDMDSSNACEDNDIGILGHIEKVVEISKESDINECLAKGKAHIEHIAQKLDISPVQAVLFSHFMNGFTSDRISIDCIAHDLKCGSTIGVIRYIKDCEALESKKLIRCRRNAHDGISYHVPFNVVESLREHGEFQPENRENLTIEEFFVVLERIFYERENDLLPHNAMKNELLDLIGDNMHLTFCKRVMSYKLRGDDFTLLLCFCHLCGNNNDDNIGAHDIKFLYDNSVAFKQEKKFLGDGSHVLIRCGFVEYNNSDGFVNAESWRLSDRAKNDLLSELNVVSRGNNKKLIPHGRIKPKVMFYNPGKEEEIRKLASLLQEENFRRVQERLEGKGMRKGFACLFSGGPGTGKTETAYQIARETGRDIMMVDISETKSMWFGESEKRIKEIFDDYRAAVEGSAIAPILLFNEADAVIGKRKESSEGSRSVDQTENTIQNIILQEMENLSGIMLATTNMAQNMDNAFERRFLYKIVFDKPGVDGRRGIWKTMLPDLSDADAAELSRRFELSGGQIENIARKVEVDDILGGDGLSMDTLARYCGDELRSGITAAKRIGFGNV